MSFLITCDAFSFIEVSLKVQVTFLVYNHVHAYNPQVWLVIEGVKESDVERKRGTLRERERHWAKERQRRRDRLTDKTEKWWMDGRSDGRTDRLTHRNGNVYIQAKILFLMRPCKCGLSRDLFRLWLYKTLWYAYCIIWEKNSIILQDWCTQLHNNTSSFCSQVLSIGSLDGIR